MRYNLDSCRVYLIRDNEPTQVRGIQSIEISEADTTEHWGAFSVMANELYPLVDFRNGDRVALCAQVAINGALPGFREDDVIINIVNTKKQALKTSASILLDQKTISVYLTIDGLLSFFDGRCTR